MASSPEGNSVITELTVGGLSDGWCSYRRRSVLLRTPQIWLFIFVLRTETWPKRRNV